MIIMVIRMPKMGGIEAMRRVLCKHKDIPIIIHTAYSNYKDDFMTLAAVFGTVREVFILQTLAEPEHT